jgi:hypothetical protein
MRGLAAAAAAALAACVGAGSADAQIEIGGGCKPTLQRVGDTRLAFAAAANGRVEAHASPGGRVIAAFDPENVNGVHTVFGVVGAVPSRDCRPAWFRVQLPMRPNGLTGFVRAAAVTFYSVRTRLDVDVTDRTLTFFRDGRRVLVTPVAVGRAATPTPEGRFYVNQRLRASDPDGPYGPGAIGISAFSPVLTEWTQNGPIAVHGTSDPGSIGHAASFGCVRVSNRVLLRLLYATATGSPVYIHA